MTRRGLRVTALLLALPVAAAYAMQDQGTGALVRVGVLSNGSYEIVAVPIELYVARVLVGEALPDSPPAALEALAVAIRTYTLVNIGRHAAEGFDLCDQRHCQVMKVSSPSTERAATATAGRVLFYKGTPASVYYSASCGGRTEKPSNVWPGADDPPYLPSRHDDGCGGSPGWSAELSRGDLQRALAAAGFTGSLHNVKIAARNESGRVARLALDGLSPAEISAQDLRAVVGRSLGWQRVQSAAFDLKRVGDSFRFTGHGAGHGVGMCVIGSTRLAASGVSALDILRRYFPGTAFGVFSSRLAAADISQSPKPGAASLPALTAAALLAPPPAAPVGLTSSAVAVRGITIVLNDAEERERRAVTDLVVRERDELVKALGVSAPVSLSVRVHPSAAAYEAATGKPWFTLGATVGAEVHLLPLSMLEERGVLERTVRHELVHKLADVPLAGRPAWVREGAAVYFSEARTGPATRGPCPSEPDLQRPVSAGALGDALARARACFERQLSSGRTWRDIR